MTEDRLSDLAVLAIEREIGQKLSLEEVVDDFASTDKTDAITIINHAFIKGNPAY